MDKREREDLERPAEFDVEACKAALRDYPDLPAGFAEMLASALGAALTPLQQQVHSLNKKLKAVESREQIREREGKRARIDHDQRLEGETEEGFQRRRARPEIALTNCDRRAPVRVASNNTDICTVVVREAVPS